MTANTTVGVLALQGAFCEHIEYLRQVVSASEYEQHAFEIIEVRNPQDLAKCSSLVIPGGESTAISLAAERTGLLEPLEKFVHDESKAVWGTCAGLIFLLAHLRNGKPDQKVLGALDIEVTRNAFGRQLALFEQHLDFSSFIPGLTDFPAVFIRAPVVSKILSKTDLEKTDGVITARNVGTSPYPIEMLYKLDDLVVAVRQGRRLGTSFHPELADDYRFHKWFIDEFVLKA